MTEAVFNLIKVTEKENSSTSSQYKSKRLSVVNNFIKNLSSEGDAIKSFELFKNLDQFKLKPNYDTYFYLIMVILTIFISINLLIVNSLLIKKSCLFDKTQNNVDKVLIILEDMKTRRIDVNLQIMNISLMICAMKRDISSFLSVLKSK